MEDASVDCGENDTPVGGCRVRVIGHRKSPRGGNTREIRIGVEYHSIPYRIRITLSNTSELNRN